MTLCIDRIRRLLCKFICTGHPVNAGETYLPPQMQSSSSFYKELGYISQPPQMHTVYGVWVSDKLLMKER